MLYVTCFKVIRTRATDERERERGTEREGGREGERERENTKQSSDRSFDKQNLLLRQLAIIPSGLCLVVLGVGGNSSHSCRTDRACVAA